MTISIISDETTGSVEYSRIPLSGPFLDASLTASLTWSTVTSVLSCTLKSTTEPSVLERA